MPSSNTGPNDSGCPPLCWRLMVCPSALLQVMLGGGSATAEQNMVAGAPLIKLSEEELVLPKVGGLAT